MQKEGHLCFLLNSLLRKMFQWRYQILVLSHLVTGRVYLGLQPENCWNFQTNLLRSMGFRRSYQGLAMAVLILTANSGSLPKDQ
jgi:hypothetical protein